MRRFFLSVPLPQFPQITSLASSSTVLVLEVVAPTILPFSSKTKYPGFDAAHLFALSRDLNASFCDFASFQDFLTLYNPLAVVPPEEEPPSCAVTFDARSPSLE